MPNIASMKNRADMTKPGKNPEMKFDKEFWENCYLTGQAGWNVGEITRPLKKYIDQIENKNIKILIPGCGNSYEAEYLVQKGFPQVHILDFSPTAIVNFKKRNPGFPPKNLHCEDFFSHRGKYDLVLEQTFFCALIPGQREDYAGQMKKILKKNGKLAGLLFDQTATENLSPPFSATAEEYRNLFSQHFNIKTLERCTNSIKPRAGRELFFILTRK